MLRSALLRAALPYLAAETATQATNGLKLQRNRLCLCLYMCPSPSSPAVEHLELGSAPLCIDPPVSIMTSLTDSSMHCAHGPTVVVAVAVAAVTIRNPFRASSCLITPHHSSSSLFTPLHSSIAPATMSYNLDQDRQARGTLYSIYMLKLSTCLSGTSSGQRQEQETKGSEYDGSRGSANPVSGDWVSMKLFPTTARTSHVIAIALAMLAVPVGAMPAVLSCKHLGWATRLVTGIRHG
ncbi:hypothetical protein FDECE_5708 [Fusarium decemcellulare]|nr:hypothetical protein FDECE_5708 [Fusarium decemcellulare]